MRQLVLTESVWQPTLTHLLLDCTLNVRKTIPPRPKRATPIGLSNTPMVSFEFQSMRLIIM